MNQILTDEEITLIIRECARGSAINRDGSTSHRIARAIEQAILNKLNEQEPVGWQGHSGHLVYDKKSLLPSTRHLAKPIYLHQAPSVPEWQPIETAPKGDGVLISIGNSVIRAMFIPEFTLEDNSNYLGDSSYKEENDTYYWPEGWYECNDHEDTHWLVDEQPTHWMPLPKPPVSAARSE